MTRAKEVLHQINEIHDEEDQKFLQSQIEPNDMPESLKEQSEGKADNSGSVPRKPLSNTDS